MVYVLVEFPGIHEDMPVLWNFENISRLFPFFGNFDGLIVNS